MGLTKVAAVACIVVAAVAVFLRHRMSAGFAEAGEVHALVERGAPLIDVRSPDEFAAGHLEGARNIPVSEISSRIADVGPKHDPVVVYCRSGVRSARAKTALERAGFTRVYNLGGMSRW